MMYIFIFSWQVCLEYKQSLGYLLGLPCPLIKVTEKLPRLSPGRTTYIEVLPEGEGNTNIESRKVVINTNYDHVTSLKKSRTLSVMSISTLFVIFVYICAYIKQISFFPFLFLYHVT